ncbi:MAG: hypothetical protein PHX09_02750 [Clostridia bacterium]|nr:hypothetical protein [Clostridia bacterium]MDD4686295.1 hypothetical protein [Clostridia bacterium]
MFKQKELSKKLFILCFFLIVPLAISMFYSISLSANVSVSEALVETQENIVCSKNQINFQNNLISNEFSNSFIGIGTSSDPYLIENSSDLIKLQKNVNEEGKNYSGEYFILTNNINLNNMLWRPIGDGVTNPFEGIFDGNGYSIKNFDLMPSYTYNGLFGVINNARIINLQLSEITATGNVTRDMFLGGLVGYVNTGHSEPTYNSFITNVSISNSDLRITSSANTLLIGGIVGVSKSNYLYISNCEFIDSTITDWDDNIFSGGIIGSAQPTSQQGTIIEYARVTNAVIVAPSQKDNLKIRSSYYTLGAMYTYYGPYDHKNPDTSYSEIGVFNWLDSSTPNKWVLSDNEILLRGVGNVDFYMDTTHAQSSHSSTPYGIGVNATITVTANEDYAISSLIVKQDMYLKANSIVGIYEISDFSWLKPKADFGYLIIRNTQEVISFTIENIFDEINNRQGYFSIDLTTTQTRMDIPIIERYYDMSTNSWQQLLSVTKNIEQGNIIDNNTLQDAHTQNDIDINLYNNIYLSAINKNCFEFTKTGVTPIVINSNQFTFNDVHMNYILNGYTLNINYINGFMFNLEISTTNIVNYWFKPIGVEIYSYNDDSFSKINTSSSSPLILTNSLNKFLGWSTTKTTTLVDFYGRTDNENYIPWKDYKALIKANRANLTETNNLYEITGLSISQFSEWNFNDYNIGNILTLYPTWGGDTIRLFTNVYAYFNNAYKVKTNVYIDTNAERVSDFYRIQKNASHNLTLKNANGTILNNSNGGYLDILWYVGEKNDTDPEKPWDTLTGSGYGTLSEFDGVITTTMSGMDRQTGIVVILVPRTDIGIEITTNGIDFVNNLHYELNGEEYISNTTKLVYGEEYTITVHNIPKGYHLSDLKNTSTATNLHFTPKIKTCSFTVDSVDKLELTFTYSKGLFVELILYVLIAIIITAILISINLYISKHQKNNQNEEN